MYVVDWRAHAKRIDCIVEHERKSKVVATAIAHCSGTSKAVRVMQPAIGVSASPQSQPARALLGKRMRPVIGAFA